MVEGVRSMTFMLQPAIVSTSGASRQMSQFLCVDLDAEVSMILSRLAKLDLELQLNKECQ